MNAIARMAAIAAAAVCVAGCSPEELEIAIPTSAVGKAANGSCGMAAATVVFKADQKSVTEKFPQIREKALPFLGKNGRITLRDQKITAKFDVPVAASSAAVSGQSLARLALHGDILKFEPTARLGALNRALREIDSDISVDFNAKNMIFRFDGDCAEKLKIKATAVFIDGAAKVSHVAEVGDGDSVDILFRCDSDASIYSQIQPFVEIVR